MLSAVAESGSMQVDASLVVHATSRTTSLDSLPIEILVRVLSALRPPDLAQAAQVCHALQAASNSALGALTSLDLRNAGATLDDGRFSVLLNRLGPKLKKLDLDCWHLSDVALKNLPEGLEELALCGCDHHSNAILSYVTERTYGSLRRFAWSGFGGSVSASGFEELALKCRKLTSFKIDSGAAVDVNRVVCCIAQNCPFLNELSAYDLSMDTFNYMNKCGISLRKLRHKRRCKGALPVTDITLVMITGMCPLLEELHLVDKSEIDGSGDVTDVGLLVLAERAPTLHTLKLKLANPGSAERCSEVAVMECNVPSMHTSRLCFTWSVFCIIVVLDLNKLFLELGRPRVVDYGWGCFRDLGLKIRVSDPPVYELIQRCPRLVELGLNYTPVTGASLELLAQHCKRIRSVSLKGCRKLNDTGLKALGQCGSLEGVNAGQASGLTDAVVAVICSGNTSLKSLVLNYAPLTDNALKAIATRSQMQELAIHGCPRISNQGLGLLSKGCPLLRYISLSYCEHISDSGVVALATGCPQLVKVRLDGCRLLSDPSVRALCQKAPKLRYLSMQHCVKLSDNVFQHLLGAASIRFVDFGRARLTPEGMTTFQHRRPFVEVFIDGRPFVPFSGVSMNT